MPLDIVVKTDYKYSQNRVQFFHICVLTHLWEYGIVMVGGGLKWLVIMEVVID